MMDNLVIRKSDHLESQAFELLGSLQVSFLCVLVDGSVHFDDKLCLGTVKVDDVSPDGVLPTESEASCVLSAKPLPKDVLRFCWVFSES